jgi:hypothetical protein
VQQHEEEEKQGEEGGDGEVGPCLLARHRHDDQVAGLLWWAVVGVGGGHGVRNGCVRNVPDKNDVSKAQDDTKKDKKQHHQNVV